MRTDTVRLRSLLAELELDVLGAKRKEVEDAGPTAEERERGRKARHPSHAHQDGIWHFDPDDDPHGFDPPPDATMKELRIEVDERLREILNNASAARRPSTAGKARHNALTDSDKMVVQVIVRHASNIVDHLFYSGFDVVDPVKIRQALLDMDGAVKAAYRTWQQEQRSTGKEANALVGSLVQGCVSGGAQSIADMDAYGNAYRVVVAAAILKLASRFCAILDYGDFKATTDVDEKGRNVYYAAKVHALRSRAALILGDVILNFDLDDNGHSNFDPEYVIGRLQAMDAECQKFRNAAGLTAADRPAVDAFAEQARRVAVQGVYLVQKYEHLNREGRYLETRFALVPLAPNHPQPHGAPRGV